MTELDIVAVPLALPGGEHRAVSKGTDRRAGIGRKVCAVVKFDLVFQRVQPVAEAGRGVARDRRAVRKRQLADRVADVRRDGIAGIDRLRVEKRLARGEGGLQLRALHRFRRRLRSRLRSRLRCRCRRGLRRRRCPCGHIHIRQIRLQPHILLPHLCGRKRTADLGEYGAVIIVRTDGRHEHRARIRSRRRCDHLHRRQQQKHRRAAIDLPAFHAHHPR